MVGPCVAFCGLTTLISIVMHQFTLPLTVTKSALFPTASTASADICLLGNSHSGWGEMEFQSCFSLYFPNG